MRTPTDKGRAMAGECAIGGRGSGGHRSGGGGSGSGERPGEIVPDTDKRLWDGAEKDGWEVCVCVCVCVVCV